jgi:ADP-heptose:LPS heptosyltransferase
LSEKILICRLGAYGDCLIITPLIRHLKNTGNEVVVLTSDRGIQVLGNNPNISKLILHEKDSVPVTKLRPYFESVREAYECDRYIDLCESIECNLAFHPAQPYYNWEREERKAMANKNYYEETFDFAGVMVDKTPENLRPEVFFTEEEEEANTVFRSNYIGKKIIVWGLAGSALHKSFPYTHIVMEKILEKYPEVVFITMGDERCEILETTLRHPRVVWKSNKWTFRESMCMVKHAFAVVCPDTGILHSAGCWDTPKLGLLTSTSQTNITKHFVNDYSIQADVPCAPCYRLIYNAGIQCPLDSAMFAPFCNAYGISPEAVVDNIEAIIQHNEDQWYANAKKELANAS